MKKTGLAFVLLIIYIINSSFAQNINFSASVKTPVGVGEQFRLVFTLNAQGSGFVGPIIKDFNVLAGPSTSSSSSISIINGSVSQSVTTTYTYVLSAINVGKFTIGPASVTVNGKRIQSNSVTVEVLKSSPGAAQQRGNSNQAYSGTSSNKNSGGGSSKTFAKIALSRTKVYQGEPIVATAKIYSKSQIVGFNNIKFPSYNGFWTEEIKMPAQISLNNEVIDNSSYYAANVKKTVLFPQKSGNIDIKGLEAECIVREKVSRRSSGNFFDDFFDFGGFSGYQDFKSNAIAPNVRITVIPLPEKGKPVDFSGAVGKFTISSSLNKKETKTNEAINLKITISGSGNLKLIDKLPFKFPPDIETYDPKISDNITVDENGVRGSRTFEYLLIPRSAGNFTIKPVEFSYFDIDKKQYVTLTTNEFNIKVEKGNANEGNTVITGVSKEDIKYIGNDIRFIKNNLSGLKDKNTFFFNSPLFFILFFTPFLLFILFILIWQQQIKQNSNIALVKNRKANRIARKRLKLAFNYLKNNKREDFFEEISKALWGYIADKFTIPVANLNKDNVYSVLSSKNVSEDTIKLFIETLSDCEFQRFAPLSEAKSMDKIYTEAMNIISKIENEIK